MKKSRRRGRPPHDDVLTKTEWAIVHAVQHGMTTRQIAERRGVSFDAVKYHIDNAMEKLGVPNRRALRRWFRVPKGSALSAPGTSGAQAGADNTPIAATSLGQISRSVKDIKLSEVWYRDVLQLRHLFTAGTFSFFDLGGARLYLFQADVDALPAESILYFKVADIQASHKTLAERGVEFINPPHLVHRHGDGTEEWMAFFKDPDGRTLAIMCRVKS
jgi:DNA-binding CsgD family transcriptional regulator/catechol 2,3-dioxygenase-like lactoylglutathione lyase family enzyme